MSRAPLSRRRRGPVRSPAVRVVAHVPRGRKGVRGGGGTASRRGAGVTGAQREGVLGPEAPASEALGRRAASLEHCCGDSRLLSFATVAGARASKLKFAQARGASSVPPPPPATAASKLMEKEGS